MIAAGAFLHSSENSGLHFVKVETLTSFRFTSLKRWFATFSTSFTICPVEKDDRMKSCLAGPKVVNPPLMRELRDYARKPGNYFALILLPRAGMAFTFFQSPKKVNKKGSPLKAIFCFAKTAASSVKRKSSLLNLRCGLSLGNGFFLSDIYELQSSTE